MITYKGSNWQTTAKDDGVVYLEIWDGARETKILDSSFTPSQARSLAGNLMKAAEAADSSIRRSS